MARKFLYAVAGAVLLVIAGLIGLRMWARQLSELAFVPSAPFSTPAPLAAHAYATPDLWLARPGKLAGDPTRWLPSGVPSGEVVHAAVFYVHPTSFYDRTVWNAAFGDALTAVRTDGFARVQASAFNAATQMWAPRYRQATFGAILTDAPAGKQALNAAYRDVLAAFDQFVAESDPRLPIVIVGHSQGALHVMQLLKDRVAGTVLAPRIAAVYVLGWPVSIAHDLPAMGLPACTGPAQSGCVLSWMSYAEPAETADTLSVYDRMPGLDGRSRQDSAILCTNPLTGGVGGSAPASANLGTLLPEISVNGGGLIGLDLGTQTIGTAFCDPDWRIASPGKTLARGKFGADKAELAALIAERCLRGIVIGLPINMDGSEGPRSQSSRAYARNLAVLGLPILLWDERWSTASAERGLIDQDFSRAKRKVRIDSAAAAVILQGAIDALTGGMF